MFFEKKYIVLAVICTFYVVVMSICGRYFRGKRMRMLQSDGNIVRLTQTVSRFKGRAKFCLNIAIVIMFSYVLANMELGQSSVLWQGILLGMLVLEQFISRCRLKM